ncbi:MAG: hypothetical protein NZO58_05250 [Gemmataceae bacterium]|nr:hypothetical protein [Gemmataceae bacterium]
MPDVPAIEGVQLMQPMTAPTGAVAAAGAHQAEIERRRRAEEEEIMTGYSRDDLRGDWQFKIVRGTFKTREQVESVIQEQAMYGWTFVEIFDQHRMRFKRSADAAKQDELHEGNPYDTVSKASGPGCATPAAVMLAAAVGLGWWWLA